MIVGLFAGCSKDGTKDPGKTDSGDSLIDQTKPAATTAKYAYQADYFDLAVPDGVQYVNQICAAGTTLYASVGIQGEEITNTDPDTGETWSYYNSRLGVLTIDPVPAYAQSFPTCSCRRFRRARRAASTATT